MLSINPLTRDTAKSTKIANFNMAQFQKWTDDVEMVYDYAVFTDIGEYDGNKYCLYYSLYNEQEYDMNTNDKHEDSEELMYKAIGNAYNGIVTYAKIALTENDGWVCELYTDKEIKELITEEQFKYLEDAFKRHLNMNIESKKKQEVLRREIENLKNRNGVITITIGRWSKTLPMYSYDIDKNKILKIMEDEYKCCKVEFPIFSFINMSIKEL